MSTNNPAGVSRPGLRRRRWRVGERGIAMITTLLVLMLMSALLVGFTAVVMSDQRFRFIDRDRGQAFYAASGGVEKLTADLGNLFFTNVAPTAAQITALTGEQADDCRRHLRGGERADRAAGQLAVVVLLRPGAEDRPRSSAATATRSCSAPTPPAIRCRRRSIPIKSGPYEGLIAVQTPYQIDVTARTAAGGEMHLIRTMEAVAIPVFQFGMFSDVDLSFFAGPNFDFGGRVHTNGNLFLAEGAGATLTLSDKVTAVKEIIRQRLQNGVSIDTPSTHDGTVSVAGVADARSETSLRTEGSVVDGLGSAQNEPTWHTISLSTYNSWIRNGRTGAKTLNLPLITVGGSNPDLIRRPPVGEDTANPILFNERLFTQGEPADSAVGHRGGHHRICRR